MRELKQLINQPLFWAGLLSKIFLILLAVPLTQRQWFLPFLQHAVTSPSIDPWSSFLNNSGLEASFPYGPVMLLYFLPWVGMGSLLSFVTNNQLFVQHSFAFALLFADFILLLILQQLLEAKPKALLFFYWLSPIVFYVNYWHGQTDIVPVVFFCASLLLLSKLKPRLAGSTLGLACAAKLSMLIAFPILVIYLARNPRVRQLLLPFLLTFALVILFLLGLPILSPGYTVMVLGSREIAKIYNVAIDLGAGLKVYLIPVLYTLMLYAAWRLERLSFDLLFALIGIAFLLIISLTPASSGWYLWLVPFLVRFQLKGDRTFAWLGLVFSFCFVGLNLFFSSGSALPFLGLDFSNPVLNSNEQWSHLHSLGITILCALGITISIRMFIHGIRRSDYFRISRRPVALGIAGDSGSGKDTLASALAEIFGSEVVTNLSGDDYHRWDRQGALWRVMTHLNPRANCLGEFASDVQALIDGRSVVSRHYDHERGVFIRGKVIKKNHFIIVSGLHALYLPQLKHKLDLSIYLDMDPELRTELKLARDTGARKRSREDVIKSIKARQPDAERYIQPQSQAADIIFAVKPAPNIDVKNAIKRSRFQLSVKLRHASFYEELSRLLIAICGLRVDCNLATQDGTVELLIEGEVNGLDLALCARSLTRELDQVISHTPKWKNGVLGLMQLITLHQIFDRLQNRLSGVQYA